MPNGGLRGDAHIVRSHCAKCDKKEVDCEGELENVKIIGVAILRVPIILETELCKECAETTGGKVVKDMQIEKEFDLSELLKFQRITRH